MKLKVLFLFFLFPIYSFSQEMITASNISLLEVWQPKQAWEYEGIYHFGIREAESDFQLFYSDGKWHGIIKSGSWKEDGDQYQWEYNYKVVDNISIKGNKFFSEIGDGEFSLYNHQDGKQKGLMFYKSYTFDGESDFGPYIEGISNTVKQELKSKLQTPSIGE